MKIIKASYEIMDNLNGAEILKKIEICGRVCYKSENRITENSAMNFIKTIINNGHESVLEHYSFSVKFIVDRGISHEIARHRIASFSQESTRYCNYGKDDEITVVVPYCFDDESSEDYQCWKASCLHAEKAYMELVKNNIKPQIARAVLPNSLKTEIVMTTDLRGWRHFFKLRTPIMSHPQMREVTIPLLNNLKSIIPIVFDDIHETSF